MAIWAQYVFAMITALSSIAIFISLILLGQQTRLSRKQIESGEETARAGNHAHLREAMFKINELFLAKPEVRKFFYDSVPIDADDPDYAYALTTAEYLLDIMEHMLWQADTFPHLYGLSLDEKLLWQAWDRYAVDMFGASPLLRDYATSRREWYTRHITDRLDRAQPKPLKINSTKEQPALEDNLA